MPEASLSPDTDRRFVQAVLARGLVDPPLLAAIAKEHESGSAASSSDSIAQVLCHRGLIDRRVAAAVLRAVRAERALDTTMGAFAPRAKPTPTPSSSSNAGAQRIGQYAILGELGRGGMGVVFRAFDTRLHRSVALKMIHDPARAVSGELERFSIEARAVAKLAHPGVVQVFDAGVHDGKPFIAMELIEGTSFEVLLAGEAPVPPRRIAEIVKGVAEALEHAHQRGIAHRDVKPQNVLLDAAGRPHLADFGLARDSETLSRVTLSGEVLGTPSYLAPEQARGDTTALGPAVDVYALGVVLYRALAGRLPFEAGNVNGLLLKIVTEDPEPLRRVKPTVHADLETIAHRCLAKEPEGRYPSAAAVAEDLRRYLDGEPILGRPVGRFELFTRRARRQPALVAAVAIALVLGVTLPVVLAVGKLRATAAEEQGRRQAAALAANEERARTLDRLSREARQSDVDLRTGFDVVGDFDAPSAHRLVAAARELTRLAPSSDPALAAAHAELKQTMVRVLDRATALSRDTDQFELVISLATLSHELGGAPLSPEILEIAAIGSDVHRSNRQLLHHAAVFLARGSLDAAEENIKLVKSRNRFAAIPYSLQADVHMRRRDRAAAIAELDRAIQLAPTRLDYRFERALYRRQAGDYAGALEDIEGTLRVVPRSPEAHGLRAQILVRMGRTAEGLTAIEAARRLFPTDANELRALRTLRRELAIAAGLAHTRLQAFEPAERELTAAIELGDRPRVPYCWRGAVRNALGRRAEAIADYRHFLEDPGEEPPGIVKMAQDDLRALEGR